MRTSPEFVNVPGAGYLCVLIRADGTITIREVTLDAIRVLLTL